MRNRRLLITTLLVMIISIVMLFAACDDSNPETHKLAASVMSFTYNGEPAQLIVDSGKDQYEVKWYEVSEEGELTLIDSAPINAGTYRALVKLVGVDFNESVCTFYIYKADPLLEIPDISKVYDGQPVSAPAYTTDSDSTNITIKYREAYENAVWTDVAPSAVGEYDVRVIVGESRNYKEADFYARFTISAQ